MVDVFTKEKRSEIMSKVKSKWTSPERKIHGALKGRKIRHRMHPKMRGNPDIILLDSRTIVFIHGCFWHGCRVCRRKMPQTNIAYWVNKIRKNVIRDKSNERALRRMGYRVVVVWEHELKNNLENVIERIVGVQATRNREKAIQKGARSKKR